MEIDLETILIELDPASLMSFDEKTQRYENEDEYDPEAEMIYPHLRDCENISEFHRKLADVFDKLFDGYDTNHYDSPYIKELSKTIWERLKVNPITKESVSILIKDEQTGLILGVSRRYDHNDFGLPGGKVEEGETPELAIIRETFEETGLKISELQKIYRRLCTTKTIYNNTTFRAYCIEGTPEDREGHKVAWVTPKQLTEGTFGDYNKNLFNHLGIKY